MNPTFVLLFLVTTLNYFCAGIDDDNFDIDIETDPIIPPPLIPDDPDLVAWTPFKSCPAGSVVTGFKFERSRLTPDDGTSASLEAIQGVAFQCSMLNRWSHFVPVKVISEGELDSQSHWTYLTHQNYAVGLGWGEWTVLDGSTSLTTGSWILKFDKEKWTIGFPRGSSNGIRREMNCPESHAICGFSAQRSLQLDIITRFRFKCCYQCNPVQTSVVVYDFANNGITDVLRTVTKRIGFTRIGSQSQGGQKEKKQSFNPGVAVDPSISYSQGNSGSQNSDTSVPGSMRLATPYNSANNSLARQRRDAPFKDFPKEVMSEPMKKLSELAHGPPEGRQDSSTSDGGSSSTMSGTSGANSLALAARFEAKYDFGKTVGFNWGATSFTNWHETEEVTDTIVCKALHRCVVTQLTGKCGKFEFNTPSFDFTQIPLRLDFFGDPNLLSSPSIPPPDPMDMKAMHPGQSWILVKFLSFFRRSGVWGPMKNCPPGTIVTGHQVRSKFRSPFTGLNLICSKLNASEMYEGVSVMATGEGEPMSSFMEKQKPAVGVAFADFRLNGTVVKQNLEFRFEDEDRFLPLPMGARNINRTVAMCPPGYAICGMQMMMDGRGVQVTDASFRCCYHCNPEEKIVVLESFTNLGYTDSIQTVTRNIGLQRTNKISAGGKNNSGLVNDVDGIQVDGIQSGFAARFDQNNSLGFNWDQTSTRFWKRSQEKTLTLLCKARHLCTFRQLIGTCGQFEIPTPYTIKESFPLDGVSGPPSGGSIFQNVGNNNNSVILSKFGVLDSSQTKEGIMTMPRIRRGETWLMAQNLTFSKNDRKQEEEEEEQWENSKICPPGTFVTAQRLKSDPVGFKFSGLSVKCSRGRNDGGGDGFDHVMELTSGDGIKQTNWYEARSPAIGFTWVQYDLNGTKWKSGWEFRFLKDVPYHRVPKGAKNISRTEVECPPDFAVCGYQALFDKGIGSRGQLTNLLLKCCYYCTPREKFIVLNAFTNSGTVDTMESIKMVIGTTVNEGTSRGNRSVNPRSSSLMMMSPSELQAAFITHFDRSHEGGSQDENNYFANFDWTESSTKLFDVTENERRTLNFTCPAQHFCSFQQRMGSCHQFQVGTPQTIQEVVPLPSVNEPISKNDVEPLSSGKERKLKKMRNNFQSKNLEISQKDEEGDLWIVAENLTMMEKSGEWEDPQICPLASVVTAFRLNRHGNPNNGLGGISLRCSKLNATGHFETSGELRVGEKEEKNEGSSWLTGPNGEGGPLIGFSFVNFQVSNRQRFWEGLWEFSSSSSSSSEKSRLSIMSNGTKFLEKNRVTCPQGHVVCGMRPMYDKRGEYILTNLALKCCHFCRPVERLVTLDSFRNLGSSDIIQNVRWSVGTNLEKKEEEEGRGSNNNFALTSPLEIRTAFAFRFANSSNSDNFDWTQTSLSLFRRRESKKTVYRCGAKHFCTVRQLMGFCNDIFIPTTYTVRESVPIIS